MAGEHKMGAKFKIALNVSVKIKSEHYENLNPKKNIWSANFFISNCLIIGFDNDFIPRSRTLITPSWISASMMKHNCFSPSPDKLAFAKFVAENR